jgi:DNA-binding IclR family transcriptional regulator
VPLADAAGVSDRDVPEAWYVTRTMRALELLAFEPLSAPQLAASLETHPRTARRLLTRLHEEGYVTRSDDARRLYTPTLRVVAIAGQIVERSPLARQAMPYVARLHERTVAAAHLSVPSYRCAMCLVHYADGGGPVHPHLRELVPAHCTASGKALLAWRARWRDTVLARPLERYTERTLIDPVALAGELEAVRGQGYATEDGEFQPGVRSVAAPVLVDEEAVAALAVSGPSLDLDRHVAAVRACAGELGAALSRRDG